MNIWLALMLAITVDFCVYLTADRDCRQNAPAFKLIPAVGGWMTVSYCKGKESTNAR